MEAMQITEEFYGNVLGTSIYIVHEEELEVFEADGKDASNCNIICSMYV